MTTSEIEALRNNLTDLLASVRKLSGIERSIAEAASEDSTEKLNELVQRAQPELMQYRALNHHREEILKQAGFSPKTGLSKLIRTLPEEDRGAFENISEELSAELKQFGEVSETADRIMQVRLANLNTKLAGMPAPDSFHDRLA